jgi:hypothetical protein
MVVPFEEYSAFYHRVIGMHWFHTPMLGMYAMHRKNLQHKQEGCITGCGMKTSMYKNFLYKKIPVSLLMGSSFYGLNRYSVNEAFSKFDIKKASRFTATLLQTLLQNVILDGTEYLF